MFIKKISTNSSLNQIITRNAKLITKKKTNIDNLLFIRQSSSSEGETSQIARGHIDKITDINQPPPGLDASTIKNTASGKEMPQNQEVRKEREADDAPTTVDSQAPAASESTRPPQIFDPKENKFIDANSASKGNTNENESDSGGKNIGDKYDDLIAELPSEQGSG